MSGWSEAPNEKKINRNDEVEFKLQLVITNFDQF